MLDRDSDCLLLLASYDDLLFLRSAADAPLGMDRPWTFWLQELLAKSCEPRHCQSVAPRGLRAFVRALQAGRVCSRSKDDHVKDIFCFETCVKVGECRDLRANSRCAHAVLKGLQATPYRAYTQVFA